MGCPDTLACGTDAPEGLKMLEKKWGPYAAEDNKILRVNMTNIRRKIGDNPAEPKYIFTESGVGYRMVESAESTA